MTGSGVGAATGEGVGGTSGITGGSVVSSTGAGVSAAGASGLGVVGGVDPSGTVRERRGPRKWGGQCGEDVLLAKGIKHKIRREY